MRSEDEGLQRAVPVAARRRNFADDCLQHLFDVGPGLGADRDHVLGGDAGDVLHFLGHVFRCGGGQVDLVDDRQQLQVGLHGHVEVG